MQNTQQTLSEATHYLKTKGIVDAHSSARFLLAHILGIEPGELLFERHRKLTSDEYRDFQLMLERRAKHEPVAYITGETVFCDLKLAVDPSVLIPRPETEQLVKLVLRYLQATPYKLQALVDIGTGSGAIALALADKLNDIKIVATDISEKSLNLAKRNAEFLELSDRIDFVQTDLIESLQATSYNLKPIFVANLPYVPSDRIEKLTTDVKDFEPHLALDGGPDGLDSYRKLFNQINELGFKPQAIFCEIDETHGALIKELAHTLWPSAKIIIEKDLAGLDRFALIYF